MNKFLVCSCFVITTLTTNLFADSIESMTKEIQAMRHKLEQMQKELDALKAQKKEETNEDFDVIEAFDEVQDNISEINKATSGNHLKWGVDYRFAIDNLNYKMADGSKVKNNAFMTNRLWLNMDWAATHQLSFHGQLAYNKAFGARNGTGVLAPYETFDWITNENAYDDSLRVRNAYFLYKNSTFLGSDVPWTFSVGRRPSTNGHIINLRDDDHAASSLGHSINVEFDGLSAMFKIGKPLGIAGMYIKLCAGRGGTNAAPKFFSLDQSGTLHTNAPYQTTQGDLADIDLAGFIFRVFSNGQYTLDTQFYYADNLIDADINASGAMQGMKTVGALSSTTVSFMINGIGDGWSDFLDDTTFFVSGATSTTHPDSKENMLGSQNSQSKTGYSYWIGAQFPSLLSEDGRWGLEYNHGSKYWRSITYAEDTNIGSKVAARGDAYEVYLTEYLIEDILSMQIRYTFIDYTYTGSNGFFGNTTGAPLKISDLTGDAAATTVDKAQDIRFYLRYRY